jgi:V8-like Glu-specific endopeptidase
MLKGLVITTTSVLITLSAYAGTKSICGANDDRVLSFDPKIGRLSVEGKHKGCTVTMISETCGITAGHCKPVLVRAEFNTPESINNEPQASSLEDVYYIDQTSIISQDEGPGKDWAVLKFERNHITGKYPGQVQGYYDVSFKRITNNTRISITGYGKDDGDLRRNFAQQYHQGRIVGLGDSTFGSTTMKHTVDTMGGNSGSTILNLNTQEVIGIHTHGGCSSTYGYNMGTIISKHYQAMKAIKKCLASEK